LEVERRIIDGEAVFKSNQEFNMGVDNVFKNMRGNFREINSDQKSLLDLPNMGSAKPFVADRNTMSGGNKDGTGGKISRITNYGASKGFGDNSQGGGHKGDGPPMDQEVNMSITATIDSVAKEVGAAAGVPLINEPAAKKAALPDPNYKAIGGATMWKHIARTTDEVGKATKLADISADGANSPLDPVKMSTRISGVGQPQNFNIGAQQNGDVLYGAYTDQANNINNDFIIAPQESQFTLRQTRYVDDNPVPSVVRTKWFTINQTTYPARKAPISERGLSLQADQNKLGEFDIMRRWRVGELAT